MARFVSIFLIFGSGVFLGGSFIVNQSPETLQRAEGNTASSIAMGVTALLGGLLLSYLASSENDPPTQSS